MENNLTNWIFKKQEYEKYTPSRREGMPPREENYKRAKGVKFILEVSYDLKLYPYNLTLANCFGFYNFIYDLSLTLSQRVSSLCKNVDLPYTCKSEETTRKMSEVAMACAKTARKDKNLKDEKEFEKWHHTITKREPTIAATLCFDLTLDHPYPHLIKIIRELEGDIEIRKAIAGKAWSIINDSIIASAAIFIASKLANVQLNEITKQGTLWWRVAQIDVYEVSEAVDEILRLYQIRKPKLVKKKNGESKHPLEDAEIVVENPYEDLSENCTPQIGQQSQSPDVQIEETPNNETPTEHDDEMEDGQILDEVNGTEQHLGNAEPNGNTGMILDSNDEDQHLN
ncbi:19588_t:CDS:2 [Cetraspora pellucida]|uniref:19588_t:CDS:1 n=1 Tax=Cetraspora pellucida TaxID=1433469 RepID=A0A9N9EQ27_9GLOM|nr:19588_t:CDS:2 [Cetraspora pellucida]